MSLDVVVVMPVYNEQDCIAEVLKSWIEELSRVSMNFEILVINDGSVDRTADELSRFTDDGRVRILDKANSGHGPTIHLGYTMAVDLADWVFQTDSDAEIAPDHFIDLWERRSSYDALLGYRIDRRQDMARKCISRVAALTVGLLFGRSVLDPNVPYRLMRSSVLRRLLENIPGDTFAPNVLISAGLAASGASVYNSPVVHTVRKTGTTSLLRWSLLSRSVKSFAQTIRFFPARKGKKP